jgi:hypothetical protein
MFQIRVLRTEKAKALVPKPSYLADKEKWHQIIFYRTALGDKFGKKPFVWISATVTHNDEVLCEIRDDLRWHDNALVSEETNLVRDNSKVEGYQYASLSLVANIERTHCANGSVVEKRKFQKVAEFCNFN